MENNKPMTFSELLPSLRGIMSKETYEKYKKQCDQRQAVLLHPPTPSNENTYKLLTMAEMSCIMRGLNSQSTRKPVQALPTRKRKWNSSVQVEYKKISHTANGKMRHNPVRKVLDMASNNKIPSATMIPMNSETPKLPKPECKAKKTYSLHDRICAVPDTPHVTGKINTTGQTVVSKEKDIQDFEEKTNTVCKEQTLENTDEIQQPMSTPFKGSRCAGDFFNDTARLDNSTLCDNNTIVSFDEPSEKDNKRKETIIVSPFDLFNNGKLQELIEFQKENIIRITMLEQNIQNLNKMKESEIKTLEIVSKLIEKKSYEQEKLDNTDNLNNTESVIRNKPRFLNKISPKTPIYNIPKRK